MFPSIAKRNLELLNLSGKANPPSPGLFTPPSPSLFTPGISPSLFSLFSQTDAETNLFEKSFLGGDLDQPTPSSSLSTPQPSVITNRTASGPKFSFQSPTPSSAPYLDFIPGVGVSRSIGKEFLGVPSTTSIPGSPASFLNTENTSEAREGPSAFDESPKSPPLKKEPSSSSVSEADPEAEGPRKKLRREPGLVLTEAEKRQRFLERNRRAAQRCRQKKKDMIERLQRESSELEKVYNQLVKEVEATKVLNSFMLSLLGAHKNCTAYVHSGVIG